MPKIDQNDADDNQLKPLLAVLGTIVSEYTTFIASQVPEDAKGFAARHAAGKAAVGHVSALSKLLHWSLAATPAQNPEEDRTMGDMLTAAREALSHYGDAPDADDYDE